MNAIITNIGSRRLKDIVGEKWISRLQVQATEPVTCRPPIYSPPDLEIRMEKAVLNFPPDPIPIYDGVIAEVFPRQSHDYVKLTVRFDYPVLFTVNHSQGIPFCVNVDSDWSRAYESLSGRVISIDPGHGGNDKGGRGPINLREKDVVLECAHHLEETLKEAGARPVLTREGDVRTPIPRRLQAARAAGAEAIVSIHTHSSENPRMRGIGVRWFNPAARDLAEAVYRQVHAQFAIKMNLPVREATRAMEYREYGAAPNLVVVEIACISNLIDEGWLRSVTFMERVATSITSGLRDFFAAQSRMRPPSWVSPTVWGALNRGPSAW